MARVYFRYGAMNSGKSTALLQVAHNYEERDQNVLIAKPSIDTKDVRVLSRLGASREVDIPVAPDQSMYEAFHAVLGKTPGRVDCLLIDEAQFLSEAQVDELMRIAIEDDIPVMAYGIRTDFRTKAFPGSLRLLEISHSLEELKTICRCGRKAMFNARHIDGVFIQEGSQVAIDGQHAEYESMCASCYMEKVGPITSA